MNKNSKIIASVVSAILIIVISIVLGMKMKETKHSLSNSNSTKNREIEIKDTCPVDSIFPDAIETYYEDDKYICTFNQIKSGCYIVRVDDKEYSLKDALNNKVITVEEAIEKGLYCKVTDSKEETNSNSSFNTNTNDTSNSNTNINTNSSSNTNIHSNSNTNTNSHIISSSNMVSASNVQDSKKIKIINKCGDYQTQVIDEFYQDNEYIYYFTSGMSGCIYVNMNGKEYGLKEALNSKVVTMKELEDVGFKCLKKSRNLVEK